MTAEADALPDSVTNGPSRLERVLEPEVMDTPEEADAYDAMDHSAVNQAFVQDLLALKPPRGEWLDLGTGPAHQPIMLTRWVDDVQVTAVDASDSMLVAARRNVQVAGLAGRINLAKADAKALSFADGQFSVVFSNSLFHHLAEPLLALKEAKRVLAADGVLFVRDLVRPSDAASLEQLVSTYAADDTPQQRQLFADSLQAALTLEEVQDLAVSAGLVLAEAEMSPANFQLQLTSDRHWTLIYRSAS
ncbi:class I SAM-dependent methyltransferase [Leptolyngbya sp. FACHB-261]|uniref:class I SAM-dependent methyltransferase n=1 Tax=Leptolyngbya sp. FACHB-261 TaxID=2692806 RepID=UPI001683B98E|nr:class I SAM-dependent methyltransferase [Leptolyngbya sp. FACHB-261]MBD2099380.1 class I SAM-dependent methyltransferase [Leptolyngbya sp. FACHB-261]